LISRHCNGQGNRRLKEALENRVARIVRETYPDFGPTPAAEKLADGREHGWCEDRAPPCTAQVFVDDPTSALMLVRFTGVESKFGYFETVREYLEQPSPAVEAKT
jgi:hypothetical protein